MAEPSSDMGLIFDWDGVIIDSEDFHRLSWDMLAEEEGLVMPPGGFEKSFGMRNEQIIPGIFGWTEEAGEIRRLADRKEALYRELVRERGIEPLAGVRQLLEGLRAAGIPAAVGSSTPRENIDAVMEVIGVNGSFQTVVASADVSKGKPDPEVFLRAAERLGLSPARCVVIEDAHVGVDAAKAGGFAVLAVATTHPASTLGKADAVHEDLTTVNVEILRGLVDRA